MTTPSPTPNTAPPWTPCTGWQGSAWRDGDWDIAAGQFFTTFRREVHVIHDFDDDRAVEWFAAMDYGYTHYTVVLLGCCDCEGNIYIVDEHAERQLGPSTPCRRRPGHVPAPSIGARTPGWLARARLGTTSPGFVAGADLFARVHRPLHRRPVRGPRPPTSPRQYQPRRGLDRNPPAPRRPRLRRSCPPYSSTNAASASSVASPSSSATPTSPPTSLNPTPTKKASAAMTPPMRSGTSSLPASPPSPSASSAASSPNTPKAA